MPSEELPLPKGRHVLVELLGCQRDLIDSTTQLESVMRACAVEAGATVVSSHFHRFAPQGVSGVVVIAESHLTIHSWPEHGYAAVDVFTCGESFIADRIARQLIDRFGATEHHWKAFDRSPMAPATLTSLHE